MIHDRIFLTAYEELVLESTLESVLSNFFEGPYKQIKIKDPNLIYAAVFEGPSGKVSLTMDKDGKVKLDYSGRAVRFHNLDVAKNFIFRHAPKLQIDHKIARLRGNNNE